MSSAQKPTVLLTNDDGPPHLKESPYVLGLYLKLRSLDWDVKVVLPSSQKSWIGKAYHIKEVTAGRYYYPKEDGTGECSTKSRPLQEGELAEWILLDGTPATCANVALHNLYPGQIDLVISGPNLGRNTSAAFSLSSGTIGAALSSSLSRIRAIALSYGTVVHPTPTSYFQPAHDLGCQIISHLWNNWGKDSTGLRNGEVDLYSINIPLVKDILSEQGLDIYWTTMWRNSYGRLFKNIAGEQSSPDKGTVNPAGPDATTNPIKTPAGPSPAEECDLLFKWGPDMRGLIQPKEDELPVGSDGWAIHKGSVSVTPLRAAFAEPPVEEEHPRRLKL